MYHLDKCKPATTTGNSQLKPTVEDEEPLSKAEHIKYRTAVGKLPWLVGIRPDLAYATKNWQEDCIHQMEDTQHNLSTCSGT